MILRGTFGNSGTGVSMLFDTDVLIWALRGHLKAARVIDVQPVRQVSVLSHMELLRGARDQREKATIHRFLLDFEAVPLSAEIGYRARLYLEERGPRSTLGVVDALVAATAVETQSALCTANAKHYRIIKDLDLRLFRP